MLVCWGQKYNEGSPIVRQSRGGEEGEIRKRENGAYMLFRFWLMSIEGDPEILRLGNDETIELWGMKRS